jgi:tetratricopeptide (TPR) repeat protein
VTEDLVDLLSVVPELRVRPRGETARFSSRARDVRQAGRELGVDVVVDGSLRRINDLVRVSFRLVTVEDGFQLWARRFDGPAAQVMNVADDAASAIAIALQTERTAEARPAATDPEAQELYRRGRFLLHRGWFEVSREGVEMLREAHARAPDDTRIAGTYALAIARVLTAGAEYEVMSKTARDLAEHTLEKNPVQCEARVALGFVHLNDGEGAAAAVQLKKALALAPNSIEALDAIGRTLVEIGRPEMGIAMLQRALANEPRMAQAKQAIARAQALLGDYDAASEIMGALPEHPVEIVPYLLMRARIALWRDDRNMLAGLDVAVQRAALSRPSKETAMGLLHFVRTRSLSPDVRVAMQALLPVDKRFAPRQRAFHGQLRVEIQLSAGEIEGAMTDLRLADSNSLLDILWLDRCPVFDRWRAAPEFMTIRESTAGRV